MSVAAGSSRTTIISVGATSAAGTRSVNVPSSAVVAKVLTSASSRYARAMRPPRVSPVAESSRPFTVKDFAAIVATIVGATASEKVDGPCVASSGAAGKIRSVPTRPRTSIGIESEKVGAAALPPGGRSVSKSKSGRPSMPAGTLSSTCAAASGATSGSRVSVPEIVAGALAVSARGAAPSATSGSSVNAAVASAAGVSSTAQLAGATRRGRHTPATQAEAASHAASARQSVDAAGVRAHAPKRTKRVARANADTRAHIATGTPGRGSSCRRSLGRRPGCS